MKQIAIIGGGAAGFMTAVTLGRFLEQNDSQARITIYEQLDRVGKKILATGNGRCNVTNVHAQLSDYHTNGKSLHVLDEGLKSFSARDTIQFFEGIGLLSSIEPDGKTYPLSGQASAVLDLLRLEAERLGIIECCDFEVTDIAKTKKGLQVTGNGKSFYADAVVLATGGKAGQNLGSLGKGYMLAGNFGHTASKVFPAIVQLTSHDKIAKALNGLKFNGSAAVLIDGCEKRREQGEILFTEYGLSGPPILQLSRLVGEHFCYNRKGEVTVRLDFLPSFSEKSLCELLYRRAEAEGHKTLENFLVGILNKKISHALIKAAGVMPLSRMVSSLSQKEINAIAQAVKGLLIPITGTKSWVNAQVTAGGLTLDEFDACTMESKIVKNVYAVGELLDVDGDCGGFNLQWAWTSGFICGQAIGKRMVGI